jgi:hypothetical protein
MSNGTTITTASSQWFSRPDDERFTSLPEMLDHFIDVRDHSRALVASTARLSLRPAEGNGLELVGGAGVGYEPTNYSFGQLATLAQAPARYLRSLPSPMAADCINYGLQYQRDVDEVGLLLSNNGRSELRAATGPRYGRVWNAQVTEALIARFGDGATGEWRVPGEFGKQVVVDKRNTTLYASDRDMWVFLANEDNRIEVAGRSLARGFFVWNSEVGASVLGLGTFLFDFVCMNRIIWGAQDYKELRIRHTVSAPDRFLDDVRPALASYASGSTKTIVEAVEGARKDRLSDVDEFLAKRYGPQLVAGLKKVHELEEGRSIETRWDVVVAATARARGITHQDARVEAERQAGSLLNN